jgi:phosphate transport system protein
MTMHLARELENLKKKILSLSALAERSVKQAVRSFRDVDHELAGIVIDSDEEMNQMEVDIEEDCLKILALHQPVAVDLRFIVAVLKINNDLERIGDSAVNIAERSVMLLAEDHISIPADFTDMAEKSQIMLKSSINALVNLNTKLAFEVCAADDEVDALNHKLAEYVKNRIGEKPEQIDSQINLLISTRNLERIADLATNIAEYVIYMVDGEIIRHQAGYHNNPNGSNDLK